MPKVKSHSGAAKRFKETASGKIKCKSIYKRHLLRKRTKKRKRHLNVDPTLNMADASHIKMLLGLKAPRFKRSPGPGQENKS